MRQVSTCILYVHPNPWDGVRARQRYLMEEMSHFADVVYIGETEKTRYRVHLEPVAEGITVVHGLMPMWLRFETRGWTVAQRLWAWRHLRHLRRRYRRIILWDAENFLRCYRFVDHDVFVYDCIDPVFSRDPTEIAKYQKREAEVCSAADLVFASADVLAEDCQRYNSRVVLLNNACAPEEYAPDLTGRAARPTWWPTGGRTIAAYLGTIDLRFDAASVAAACEANPEVDFVVAGGVVPECQHLLQRLAAYPNVIAPGRISVDEGRFLLANTDVGLIPFTRSRMNDAINPVKLYAYALLGKPVVGTAIRELQTRPEWLVSVAADPVAFAEAVRLALNGSQSLHEVEARRAFALSNTWRHRASVAWSALEGLVVPAPATRRTLRQVAAPAVASAAKE